MTRGLRARSRAVLTSGATLAAFRIPGYPALWLSSSAGSIGWSVGMVAIGWITLQVTNSPFAVGGTLAARLAPALLLGIPLGGLVDRFDRRRTLIAVNLAGMAAMLFVAGLAAADRLGLVEILVVSIGLGVVDTLRGTANGSYAVDLAGPEGATNAIALSNLGGQLLGSGGGIAGGLILENLGAAQTFAFAALPALVAAAALFVSGPHARRGEPAGRISPSFVQSMTLVLRNRLVGLIALVVIIGEVLGFSSITVFPTFARDVLNVDAGGLGAMAGARAIGGVVGLLALATLGFRGRGGALILLAAAGFGLSLVAFSISTIFLLSLLLLTAVGASAAAMDALGQSLIQQSVGDHERGAAMGVWFFAIGFGPFGHLGLGAAASAVGAPLALAISGVILTLVALALSTVRSLRRLA